MSLNPSPTVNGMIFVLTGERLIDADEDKAFESREPFTGAGGNVRRIAALIAKSIHDIGEVMPDDLGESYKKAMSVLIDDGGKSFLHEFADQLDKIAEGRRKISMDIMESKWQVIAEVVRLLLEIAIYMAMSFFTGGATASQIMMAKLRSRFMILATMAHLAQRLHIAPTLSEAIQEAFTTFAVRLAMMNFAPEGRRPDGIDWKEIGKAAAFGAAAGLFTSIFNDFAKNIVKSYDSKFLKNGPDRDFKNNPDLRNGPNPGSGRNSPNSTPGSGPGPNPGRNGDNPPNDRSGSGPNGSGPNSTNNPLSFRNNPDLWRNNQILRNNADRPGALAGHYGLKGTADFLAAGSGEALAEILIKGAFEGDWSTSWSTFVGAGVSSQVEASLQDTALNTGAELRNAIDKLRNQPPTVSGGTSDTGGNGDSDTRDSADSSRSRDGDTADSTDGPVRTETTGGDGSALASPPPVTRQSAGQGDFTGTQPPPPRSAETLPPYAPQNQPSYPPGSSPVSAAENELWQQVHNGPAEVREQALRDIADLRGSQPPGSTDTGVRESLNSNLSQPPEVPVGPGGDSVAAQGDADQARRTFDDSGTPTTVDDPLTTNQGNIGNSPTTTGGPAAGPTGQAVDSVADDGSGAHVGSTADREGAASGASPDGAHDNAVVDSAGNAVVDSAGHAVVDTSGNAVVEAAENPVVDSPENGVVPSPEGNERNSPNEEAEQGTRTETAPGQVAGSPVASNSPNAAATPGTGTGARPGGVPTAGGTPASSSAQPQGSPRPSDSTAPVDGSPATTDGSPQTSQSPETPQTPQSPENAASPDTVNSPETTGTSDSTDSAPTPADDTTATAADDTTAIPADDTTAAPSKVSTTSSYDGTGGVRDTSGTIEPSSSVDEAAQGVRLAPPTNPAPELVAAFDALKGLLVSSGPARTVPVPSPSSEPGSSSAVRGGVSPEPEPEPGADLRRSVRDGLAALPGVTVVVDDAANYGHQAAATMLMDSLSELGYPGRITVVAPGSVQERLRLLVPESMRERVDWHTGEFGSGSSGPGVQVAEGSLVLVAASDRLDGGPGTAREFLDFVGADQAVVLKPYAWGASSRMVYSRAGAGAPVTVHALEGEAGSGLIPKGTALYRFDVPKLSGPELDALIAEQVGGVRGEGLRAVADAVRDGRVDVMPVYGLHNVDAPGRASAVGTLASGLHAAGRDKPSVVITFGDAMVPFAPRHRAEWLGYAGLGDA
ncbi:hypothetical protein ABZ822_31595, partial [Streptomyces sp. NPDC047108]